MKKILTIAVIAGTLIACDNEANNTDNNDSVNITAPVTTDTNTMISPMDTTSMGDTSRMGMDTSMRR